MRRTGLSLAALAAALAWTATAGAVAKLDLPMAKHFEVSKLVLAGTVTGLRADVRVLEIKVDDVLRGDAPGQQIRLQIAAPAELFAKVAIGHPVVLFQQRMAAVHLADAWLQANPIPGAPVPSWRVVQAFDGLKQTFPGRTEALVRLVKDLKAGKRTILDRWDHKPFAGGVKARAKLGVQKATWMLAADCNGDRKPDLVVGAATGPRLFLAKGDGYEDATAGSGLPKESSGYRAAGDVNGDGHCDLLLGGQLWTNAGGKFTAKAKLDVGPSKPLAAGLLDLTGDGRPDALILAADGQFREFQNTGSPEQAWTALPSRSLWKGTEAFVAAFGDWGDGTKPCAMVVGPAGPVRYGLDVTDGPEANLERLTGVDLRKNARYRDGVKCLFGAALRMEGDDRPDLFVATPAGTLLLLNRGFGTFLLDDNALATVGQVPVKLAPDTPWAAADLHARGCDDLLVLADDGTLYEFASSR